MLNTDADRQNQTQLASDWLKVGLQARYLELKASKLKEAQYFVSQFLKEEDHGKLVCLVPETKYVGQAALDFYLLKLKKECEGLMKEIEDYDLGSSQVKV